MTAIQFNSCVQAAMNYASLDDYVSDLSLSTIWGDKDGISDASIRFALRSIYTAVNRTPKEIVAASGLSQAAFARKHCIPVRTVNNWCLPASSPEHRDCPLYVRLLLQRAEGLLTC